MMILIVGTSANGISKTGFKTIGKPKIIGSLIPKIPGTSDNCDSFFTRWLLHTRIMTRINESVDPPPPKVANISWN